MVKNQKKRVVQCIGGYGCWQGSAHFFGYDGGPYAALHCWRFDDDEEGAFGASRGDHGAEGRGAAVGFGNREVSVRVKWC